MTNAETCNVEVFRQGWSQEILSMFGYTYRPDGDSYHKTLNDLDIFIKEYKDSHPDLKDGDYSFPTGKPEKVKVPQIFADTITGYGIRVGQHKVDPK